MKTVLILFTLALVGCTDTDRANWGSLGSSGHIVCYSGGKLILETDSTGKPQTVTSSDGWEFLDAKTKKFTRVSGDCIITN